MPIPCLRCRKNMSRAAVICPHCGTRQADRDPRRRSEDPPEPPKPLSLSKDEVGALFSIRGADVIDLEEQRGPLALVLPSPDATGSRRLAEWGLTIAAAPLLVPGFVFALFRLRFLGNLMMRASETTLTLAIGSAGALGVWSIGMAAGLGSSVTGGIVGLGIGALATRLYLRRRHRRRRA